MTSPGPAPHELLDDGHAPPPCDLLVIGCGNLLRGDDGVGPIAIRTLWQRGVPGGVRLADGGTAGMDVAFQMRGAERVIILDAARTGATPGTLFKVPGHELEELPSLGGIHMHSFRWDHALAFGRWLLGPDMPADVTVLLIEAAQVEAGAPLSAPARTGMERAIALVENAYRVPAS